MIPGASVVDAVAIFLLRSLKRRWCDTLVDNPNYMEMRKTLLEDLDAIKEDLSVLRDADRNVASMRFVRGIDLMVRLSLPNNKNNKSDNNSSTVADPAMVDSDVAWKDDLVASLDSAEHGYHRVKTMEQKILCFEIICSCFLLLRSTESALYSILNAIKVLMREAPVVHSITSLHRAVTTGSPLTLEECELLEVLLSRVCGIIVACESLQDYDNEFRKHFRDIFRNNEYIKEATDPGSFHKWANLRVYKHSSKVRIYGTAAHALVPVVPVLSGVATMLSGGKFRPKNAGVNTLKTIPLKEKCKENGDSSTTANLYDFRWALLDLSHSVSNNRYRLGQVSLSMDSKTSTWCVLANGEDDDKMTDTCEGSLSLTTDASNEGEITASTEK